MQVGDWVVVVKGNTMRKEGEVGQIKSIINSPIFPITVYFEESSSSRMTRDHSYTCIFNEDELRLDKRTAVAGLIKELNGDI